MFFADIPKSSKKKTANPKLLTGKPFLDVKFAYPEGGYIYYTTETPKVFVEVSTEKKNLVKVSGKVTDYNKAVTQTISLSAEIDVEGVIDIEIDCKKLGYFLVELELSTASCTQTLKTGFGYTTPHERSEAPYSCFGISNNYGRPSIHYPIYAKMGMRYVRAHSPDKDRPLLEKYGLTISKAHQGYDILEHKTQVRYAAPFRNSAYHYEKMYGHLLCNNEHGNEHWEEKNLALLTEWHKVTGLARIEANPKGWYSNSGCPGIDINKLAVMFDNGLADYITCLCMHAYSFPGCPEANDSYWSVGRLYDFAKFLKERNIYMPVSCTEQGYPAMYDQVKCESYSPGEMSTLEGQSDYLVRSWVIFLSMGISKVIWFNGAWYDGFGILEKDGPAPWPAAMALCELVRAVDHCDYVGDLEHTDGTYYKVFRNRNTNKLVGVVWHPVYYTRSCIKESNLTFDGKHTEADGTAQEKFDYQLKHMAADTIVKDIMGNEIDAKDGKIVIGESPVYVHNLSEDIVESLVDKTIFPVKYVTEKPMPSKIILGLSDAHPSVEPYLSSKFKPGETRTYKLRVHNYSDKDLDDTIVIDAPKPFSVDNSELEVSVPAGMYQEYVLRVKCDDVAPCGEFKIHAKSTTTDAHPVYQIAAVYCPVYVKTLKSPLCDGTNAVLCVGNLRNGQKDIKVKLSSKDNNITFEHDEFDYRFTEKGTGEISFKIVSCDPLAEPVMQVELSDGVDTANYDVVIPMAYVEYSDKVNADEMKDKQKFIVSGYNMTMTAALNYNGPELFGTAKPEPLNAYARIEMDDKKVYFHFDIHDDTVVCNKVTRRNNIDSDGVWIRLYNDMADEKPYRNFCIMPVDQAGQTSGCKVTETAKNILFATPYTDYDFSKISAKSEVFEDRYTIDVAIDRDSINMSDLKDNMIINFRIINMDHKDWSKFYDTGKIEYKILK